MVDSPSFVIGGLFIAVLALVLTKWRSQLPLPPGPRGLPIIGNLLDLPKEKDWEVYQHLAHEHGDVLSLKVPGATLIILNSVKSISDLLEARSAVYSSRPPKPSLELFGHSWTFAVWPYGPQWRYHRKLMRDQLQPTVVDGYQGIQIRASRILLKRLMEAQENVATIIRKTVGIAIIDLAYGLEKQEDVENFVTLAEWTARSFVEVAVPGAYLVDFVPALKYLPPWFPFATACREAVESRTMIRRQLVEPIETVKRSIIEGKARTSMVHSLIDRLVDGNPDSIPGVPNGNGIHEIPANTYTGGIDSTTATLTYFCLAMLHYPHVQITAQQEIDEVVGGDRLPEFKDLASLTYMQAVIMETLRWYHPIPIALPHSTLEDDVYKGWHIPKGSIVIGNAWAIFRDPHEYPEPESFRPERFLKRVGRKWEIDEDTRDPRSIVFGYGRRVCPGKYLGEQTLYANISAILAAYSIEPHVDEHGNAILPDHSKTSPGLILQPLPFKCTFKPRSRRAAELISNPLPERGL